MDKPHAPRLVLATIFLLSLTEFLQAGMTAFAAGPLMGGIGLAPEEFSLVAAVHATAAILAISMQRWFVERVGGRRYVQGCAAFSVLGALLCAIAHDLPGFLVGRAVMGLGGGAFFTACRMIIHHALKGPARFVGIRCLASGLAIGIAAAPWVASVAVAQDLWPALYVLVAALAAAVFVLAGLALPTPVIGAPHARSHAAPAAQLLLAAASFLVLHALHRAGDDFEGDAPRIAITLAAGLAGVAAWAWHQHRSPRPLLRLRELLRPRYLRGMALFLVAYLMLGANNIVVPSMLQGTLGLAWETVGHVEAIGSCVALLTWFVLSRLLPRYPAPRKFLVAGFGALALCGTLLARLDTGADAWRDVLPALAFNSVFLLTVLPVAAMQTFREMEHDEPVFSNAQQLKNMVAQAGMALGIAAATLGQQWRGAFHVAMLQGGLDAANPAWQETLATLQQAFAASLPAGEAAQAAVARVVQMLAQQASMLAAIDHFTVVALVGIAGIVATLVQRTFR